MRALSGVYRPRQPKLTPFYRVIEEHFERFEQVYPERYEQEYGFWRPKEAHSSKLIAQSS